jgi:hypothetical protein
LRMACGAEEDRDLVESARKLFHGSPAPRAAVSLPALGEFILTVERDCARAQADEAIRVLLDAAAKGFIEFVGCGADAKKLAAIVGVLTGADERLKPADALIAAALVLDPRADFLYTTDGVLVGSASLLRVLASQGKATREFAADEYRAARNRRKRF